MLAVRIAMLLFSAAMITQLSCGCSCALYEQYRSYYYGLPKEHPARYVVNQTAGLGPSTSYRIRYAMNEDGKLNQAKMLMKQQIELIELAKNWKYPRQELSLSLGGKGISFNGEYELNTDIREAGRTRWNLRIDRQAIYAELDCQDDHRFNNDQMPYDGDSFEIFICTNYTARIYREIVINPGGTIFTAVHVNHRYGAFYSLFSSKDVKHNVTATVADRRDGYRIQVRIPWSELPEYTKGNPPKTGEDFYFILIRTGKEEKNGPVRYTAPIPFLFSGHNVFGYIHAVIQ